MALREMNLLMRRTRGAYTLVEVLVVVTIMGIAGALVIPSIDQAGVLRSQAAVRTIVSDIAFAQSDAVAMQEQRAIVFNIESNRYTICRARGSSVDPEVDFIVDPYNQRTGRYEVTLTQEAFGNVRMTGAEFDQTDAVLIFDEFGAPVVSVGSNTPSAGGTITLRDDYFDFTITLESFTGRVVTSKTEIDDGAGEG